MKTPLTMLAVAGAVAALAAPAGATKPSTTAKPASAREQCRTERSEMGRTAFRQAYGTNENGANAFGKCVSAHRAAMRDARRAARDEAASSKRG